MIVMAAPQAPEEWASIKDFTPGIHQRLGPNYPPGTAQEHNTYRCHGLEGGTLAPLACRLEQTITQTPVADPVNLQSEEVRITGLHVVGPVFWGPEASPGIDQNNTDIFMSTEEWVADTYTLRVYRYRRHRSLTPGWELVWTSDVLSQTYDPRTRPTHTTFGTGRSNNADPTVSGPTAVTWVTAGFARFFPDDLNPGITGTVALPGDKTGNPSAIISPDLLVMHQGRTVLMPLTLQLFGAETVYTHNEALYWTAVNDFRTMDAPSFTEITVGPENPVGYAVAASLTANELFLLKLHGGALMVQGDVSGVGPSSPTARTLPYVKSPGMSMNNGTYGVMGYVYPIDGGGVWLWQGGDLSQHLTKNLAPEFWRPPAVDLDGNDVLWGYQWSQCDKANNWMFFPNNWMWDTDTNGWWRTENPDDVIIHRWAVDMRGHNIYGATRGFRSVEDPAVLEYGLTKFVSSYSWQSQPLSTTLDSSLSVTHVALVASGSGTLHVTCSSRQDPAGKTRSFQVTSGTDPTVTKQAFGVRGTHITFRIVAEAFNTTDPAPYVHELRYQSQAANPLISS